MPLQSKRRVATAIGCVAAFVAAGAPAARAAGPREVRYVDAHSHLFKAMSADDEVAAFRKAGLAGVILMWPDPAPLSEVAKRNRGYVLPWISLSALQGTVVGDDTAAEFMRARDVGGFCGLAKWRRGCRRRMPRSATRPSSPIRAG